MKIRAKVKNNRLVVRMKFAPSETLSTRELESLGTREIQGILKPRQIRRNVLEYTGSSGIPFGKYLERTISKAEFYHFMIQIAEAVRKVREGNLFINRLVFDLRYVYVNEGTRDLLFLYVPMQSGYAGLGALKFMEEILYAAKIGEDTELSIAKYRDFIRKQSDLDPDAIKAFISRANRGLDNRDERTMLMEDEADKSEQTALMEDAEEDTDRTVLMKSTEEQDATGFMEETDSEGKKAPVFYAVLIHRLTKERIEVDKTVFRLGKGAGCVDHRIDNGVVSRIHADIITRDGHSYVYDQNSLNHTYINDIVLPAKIEKEIHDGDILRLADEEFEFHI